MMDSARVVATEGRIVNIRLYFRSIIALTRPADGLHVGDEGKSAIKVTSSW